MFRITELFPTPILRDFKIFIETLMKEEAILSPKNQYLARDLLWGINQQVSLKAENVTPRLDQASYPLFHLFYHLSLAGKLTVIVPGKGQKLKLKVTERYQGYLELTTAEQYFFLLETLWIDVDWQTLQKATYSYRRQEYSMASVWSQLMKCKADETLDIQSEDSILCNELGNWGYFLWYFSYFGFWNFTCNEEELKLSRRNINATTLTPTAFGIAIAPILYKYRDYLDWNKYNLRRDGLTSFEVLDQLIGIAKQQGFNIKGYQELVHARREGLDEPFFKAFVPMVGSEELKQTLLKEEQTFFEGTYTFKVSLTRGIWRKIELAAKHSLDDLHTAIQEAFDFNNDHLYSFFMDNKKWSYDRYTSPNDEEGPFADEVALGELQLFTGKTFLYLFDYGDEWEFRVEMEEISSNKPLPLKPQIVSQKGEAPPQYNKWWF